MIFLYIVMLFSVSSIIAMEQKEQSFNKAIAQLSLSAQESKNSNADISALVEDLKTTFKKAIELANSIGENSENNGLIALHAKALEQLKLNPDAFMTEHEKLSSIMRCAIMLEDTTLATLLTTAQQKIKEMHQAWLAFRKKVAYAAQAHMEKMEPNIKFPPHESGESKDAYGVKFIQANKELDSNEVTNYTALCASIITLLGPKDEERKALLKECDIFNKL